MCEEHLTTFLILRWSLNAVLTFIAAGFGAFFALRQFNSDLVHITRARVEDIDILAIARKQAKVNSDRSESSQGGASVRVVDRRAVSTS